MITFASKSNDKCRKKYKKNSKSKTHFSGDYSLKKKVQAKQTCPIKLIFFSSNCTFGSFKLFPSSKIDFWPFLKLQKMEFGQKKFREIDLFDFTSFFFWPATSHISQL